LQVFTRFSFALVRGLRRDVVRGFTRDGGDEVECAAGMKIAIGRAETTGEEE